MSGIDLVVLIGVSHFVGDFLFQSNWMALNKSKTTVEGTAALFLHAFVYGLCFIWLGLDYALITMGLHYVTDFITSRIVSKLWFVKPVLISAQVASWPEAGLAFDSRKRHWFFVMIGFDQLLHLVTLLYTLRFLP